MNEGIGMKNGDTTHEDSGVVGGEQLNPATVTVTPDMLYKLSKKIAQLTKVIYSLNTRNDDLEVDLETVRSSYEEKLQILAQSNEAPPQIVVNGNHHEIEAMEAKSALAEAMQTLQQTEGKLKAMEEDLNKQRQEVEKLKETSSEQNQRPVSNLSEAACQTTSSNSPSPAKEASSATEDCDRSRKVSLLEQQVKQLNKDKKEMKFRLDRMDILNENSRLESEALRKEMREVEAEKNKLRLELSAVRIELNYQKEVGKAKEEVDSSSKANGNNEATRLDDKFTDELIEKIETLTREKADLSQALENALKEDKKPLEEVKEKETANQAVQTRVASVEARGQQTEDQSCDACTSKLSQISTLEAQVEKLREEKLHCEQQADEVRAEARAQHEASSAVLRSETEQLQETLDSSRKELEHLRQEVSAKQADLETEQQKLVEAETAAKADRQAIADLQAEKESLSKELSESKEQELHLKVEMGQNSEKLYAVEERCKSIEKERDDLKRKCKEFEARIDVLNRKEQAEEKDASERLLQLEKALEEALVEREEILEAAEKEIQAHKTMAIETEQKMMDDFEWKLREIESDYRDKIKTIEDGVEQKVKTSVDQIVRQKDEEFSRMSITMRREMDDKVRLERNALKTALDTQYNAQKDKAIELYRLEKDHEIRILQKSWEDEQDRLNREVQRMQRTIDNLPHDIEAATRVVKAEYEAKIKEERRKVAKVDEKAHEEADRVRLEMAGQMRRVQAQYDEKIADYEAKLEAAHGNRMSSMFQMKEEVEAEFTERMEQLRDMYKRELELQAEKLEEEALKTQQLEESLRHSIQEKQQEIDDLNAYYVQREEELEAKINELLTRLQESTSLNIKLKAELDEYEWYEEDEEVPPRPASAHSRHSRPPSTKPLDQYKYTQPITETEEDAPQEEEYEQEEEEEEPEVKATAAAAHNNYVSMTSLYASAQTSAASEVSTQQQQVEQSAESSPYPPPRSRGQPPLAEEAFLTEADESSSQPPPSSPSPPPPNPQQPQQYTKRTSTSSGSSSKKSQCSQQ